MLGAIKSGGTVPLFSVLFHGPAKNLVQPPAQFKIRYNNHALRVRRRQSHFLLRTCYSTLGCGHRSR